MTSAIASRLVRNRWRFAAAVLAVVVLVTAGVAVTQADLKAKAMANHVELASAEARGLEDYLTEHLKAADLVVQTLVQGHPDGPGSARLLQVVRDIPVMRSLSWLDPNGRVLQSSAAANVGMVVDPTVFLPVTDTPLPTWRVGQPWTGRDFSNGLPLQSNHSLTGLDNSAGFVALLREVTLPGGVVRRVLVAMNTDHVINGYLGRVDDPTAAAELWRYDGVLLLSTQPERRVGALAESPDTGVLARLAQRDMGTFSSTQSDGAQVLTAYRASAVYPLVTVVRHDHATLLEPWAQANRTLWATVLAVLVSAAGLATFFYWRAERAAIARWQQRQHMRLAASVFTHAQEAITITDLSGNIVSVNEAFCRITGYSPEEVVGHNPRILSSGRQSPEFYAQMWQSLADNGQWAGEIWNRRKSGEVYAEMINITAVPDETGQPQNYVAIFQDITQQKTHQDQLEHIAHFDALTNLPNRVLLADRLQQALSQAQRRGNLMAVVFVDLDHFKEVNDAHGHAVGDQLLVAIAQRLRDSLRDGDTLARVGGDEFVAVLVDVPDLRECELVLERLLSAASQPVALGGQLLQVSASLGAALYPQDGTEADTLLRHADQAMYQAKQTGKNRYQLFDVVQDITTRKRMDSRTRLAQALMQGEFVLHYQPKVNLRLGRVVGAEALVRWQDPQRGLLAPGLFLPDIEGHALSTQLGDWVLCTALAQLDDWQQAGIHVPLSVNIAAHHLQQPHFVARLAELLRLHPRVLPADLELEVLETSALEDIPRVSAIMRECQSLGVSFALDDFGTGYSSLTYLKRLPASVLKIDQSFIRDMLASPDDLAIVQGVIGLAKAFGRGVIAEGVETRAHGDLLQRLGCDLAQGYGVARPMPAHSLPGWVAAWQAQPRWAHSA
jgi:diguanylate cyclase (GGDEF)-like protein/PAS domain S-box-containing protein